MARKATSSKSSKPLTTSPAAGAPTSTPVRNTPLPPRASGQPARKEITQDMIAKRAYEIAMSGQGGSDLDNWLRAERELRGV